MTASHLGARFRILRKTSCTSGHRPRDFGVTSFILLSSTVNLRFPLGFNTGQTGPLQSNDRVGSTPPSFHRFRKVSVISSIPPFIGYRRIYSGGVEGSFTGSTFTAIILHSNVLSFL